MPVMLILLMAVFFYIVSQDRPAKHESAILMDGLDYQADAENNDNGQKTHRQDDPIQ